MATILEISARESEDVTPLLDPWEEVPLKDLASELDCALRYASPSGLRNCKGTMSQGYEIWD